MSIKRYKKKQTVWCNNCDMVFDTLIAAEEHVKHTRHSIKVIEFITD
jgi:hypothetical protein